MQVVWLKEAIAGEDRPFPRDMKALQKNLRQIVRTMRFRYPNLKIVYRLEQDLRRVRGNRPQSGAGRLRQRIRRARRDPGAHERQAEGPVAGRGPYLWTDGLAGRNDGLQWTCQDVDNDGTHPSKDGAQKVVTLLTTFFKSDPTAKRWYVARPQRIRP